MEVVGVPIGTLPQWGSFGALVFLVGLVLRYLPERMRAATERLRARTEGKAAAAQEWQAIEARVKAELDECRRERTAAAADRDREREAWFSQRRRLDDESFRMKLVLTLLLDEVERLDPASDIILKAKSLLVIEPSAAERSAEPPDAAGEQLAEILDRIPDRPGPRRRGGKSRPPGGR